jgi:hypothetical protein
VDPSEGRVYACVFCNKSNTAVEITGAQQDVIEHSGNLVVGRPDETRCEKYAAGEGEKYPARNHCP